MNYIKNVYLEDRNHKLVIEVDDNLINLIKPFIGNKDFVYLGEYPLIVPDSMTQSKLNKKGGKHITNEFYNIPQNTLSGEVKFNKFPVIMYNNIKYVCVKSLEDNKRNWIEIRPVKWQINESNLEFESSLFVKSGDLLNEDIIKKYVVNDMFQGINNSNIIYELARLNGQNLKDFNLYSILNNSKLNFNSLTSEEIIILGLMLGLFKGKTFKFEDVASLLDIDIEEVLYKYKSGINKLEIIINKSLSDESKRTEKSLTMINKRR